MILPTIPSDQVDDEDFNEVEEEEEEEDDDEEGGVVEIELLSDDDDDDDSEAVVGDADDENGEDDDAELHQDQDEDDLDEDERPKSPRKRVRFDPHVREIQISPAKFALRCEECNFGTETREDLYEHRCRDRVAEPSLACCLCDYKTDDAMDLSRHEYDLHGLRPEVFRCHLGCDEFRTGDEDRFVNHMRVKHSPSPLFKCHFCEHQTYVLQKMNAHYASVHKAPFAKPKMDIKPKIADGRVLLPFKRKFSSSEEISPSKKAKINDGSVHGLPVKRAGYRVAMYECGFCVPMFSSPLHSNWLTHMRKQHSPSPYLKCNLCSYGEWIQGNFISHCKNSHGVSRGNAMNLCQHFNQSGPIESAEKEPQLINNNNNNKHEHGEPVMIPGKKSPMYPCFLCDSFATPIQQSWRAHMRKQHSPTPLLSCKCRKFESWNYNNFGDHIKRAHNGNKHNVLSFVRLKPPSPESREHRKTSFVGDISNSFVKKSKQTKIETGIKHKKAVKKSSNQERMIVADEPMTLFNAPLEPGKAEFKPGFKLPLHTCHICDSNYPVYGSWLDHMRSKHMPCPLLVCNRCNFTSETMYSFARHCQKQHGCARSDFLRFNKTHVEAEPQVKAVSTSVNNEWERSSEFGIPLHFMAINEESGSLEQMRETLATKEEEFSLPKKKTQGNLPVYDCQICSMQSPVEGRVRQHMLDLHRPNPLFKCPICPAFETFVKSKFRDHCRIRHSVSSTELLQFADRLYCS